MMTPDQKAEVLNQALPYIQRFRGQTFVIKYGGAAMRDRSRMQGVIRNVLLLQLVGIRPILVHGGGPEIDKWLGRLGMEKKVVEGLRVTDEETMEVVEVALSGKANKSLVTEVHRAGGKAVGLSGRDGALFYGEPVSEELGRVGRILKVDPSLVINLAESGYVPVVCSIAVDSFGQALNVNADNAAAALAVAVQATKLILLTDTNGLLSDLADATSTMSELSSSDVRAMISNGRLTGGMIPKVEASLEAIEGGVSNVHLINGSNPNAILVEVFTDAGVGTMIRG